LGRFDVTSEDSTGDAGGDGSGGDDVMIHCVALFSKKSAAKNRRKLGWFGRN
jgi:hypothetical protein